MQPLASKGRLRPEHSASDHSAILTCVAVFFFLFSSCLIFGFPFFSISPQCNKPPCKIKKWADTRFFVNWQTLVLDLPHCHSGCVHLGHSLSGILGICLQSADVQTLLKYICITKPATMISNVPVMGAKKTQNVGYCLACVTCMCVLVCKRACARVFVDNDEWALHQSNLLRRLHEGSTNHFGKHVSEEGFPCQMLSWASVWFWRQPTLHDFPILHQWRPVHPYLQMMFTNTFSQFNWGQFNTFLISTYCLQVQMFSSCWQL